MIGLVAATENGRRNAAHLAGSWNDARLYKGKPKDALNQAWKECDAIVLFLATGAAVRLLAPLLQDKHTDPGVVAVDDACLFAVALCGGHDGGANGLAARAATSLGATPVVTTASDALGFPALDSFGRNLGLRVEEGRVRVGGAALARQADERALGLVEELLVRVLREVGVRYAQADERHEHAVRARRQLAPLGRQAHRLLVQVHDVRDVAAQDRRRAAQLPSRHEGARLA